MRKTKLMVALGLAVLTLASVTGCACQKGDNPQNVTQTVNTTTAESTDIVSKFNDVFKDYTIQDLATAVPSMKSALADATGATMLIASDNADVNKSNKAYILVDGSSLPNGFNSKAASEAMSKSYERQFGAPTSKTEIDGKEVTWYKVSQGSTTVYVCVAMTDTGFVNGMDTDESSIVDNMNKLGIKVK